MPYDTTQICYKLTKRDGTTHPPRVWSENTTPPNKRTCMRTRWDHNITHTTWFHESAVRCTPPLYPQNCTGEGLHAFKTIEDALRGGYGYHLQWGDRLWKAGASGSITIPCFGDKLCATQMTTIREIRHYEIRRRFPIDMLREWAALFWDAYAKQPGITPQRRRAIRRRANVLRDPAQDSTHFPRIHTSPDRSKSVQLMFVHRRSNLRGMNEWELRAHLLKTIKMYQDQFSNILPVLPSKRDAFRSLRCRQKTQTQSSS